MKWFVVLLLSFNFQALAANNETQCENDAKADLTIFIEQIRGTSISGAKIKLVKQTNDDLTFTSTFSMESMGTLWPTELYEVVSDLDNHCLTESIRYIGPQ